MAQAGNDRLDASVAAGAGPTTLGPYLLPDNLLVDISILLTNGATAPTVEGQVEIQWRYESGGSWHSMTVIGSNVNDGVRSLQNKILSPGIYEYQYIYTGGTVQAMDMLISEGRYSL